MSRDQHPFREHALFNLPPCSCSVHPDETWLRLSRQINVKLQQLKSRQVQLRQALQRKPGHQIRLGKAQVVNHLQLLVVVDVVEDEGVEDKEVSDLQLFTTCLPN